MRSASATSRAIVTFALLTALAGCWGPGPKAAPGLDKGQVLDPDRTGPDTIARTFECQARDAEGNCLANKCTAGPGGATHDCGSFAKACIDADLHWKGSKSGGVCTVPL
jgi:hypothetical protein